MSEKEENSIDNKAFTEECHKVLMAMSDALYAIGGKWKLIIIIAMGRVNKRFTEIQRQVSGISVRVLSSELKELEMNVFIIKK